LTANDKAKNKTRNEIKQKKLEKRGKKTETREGCATEKGRKQKLRGWRKAERREQEQST